MYSLSGSLTRITLPALLGMAFAWPATAQDSPQPASDTETQNRIENLELRLDSLQKQVTESALERVRLNGFLSIGYTRATNDAGYDEATEKSDLQTLTLAALQATFTLGRNTEAVTQLVSRGSDDWNTELEWGFLRHNLTNSLQFRAGKMRLPLFMESETLEIGYGQPWARPPEAVYDPVPLRSYLGGDLSYTFSLPNSTLETKVFSGHVDDQAQSLDRPVNVELRNLTGLVLHWTDYVWTLRSIYAHTRADITYPPQLSDIINNQQLLDSISTIADDAKTEFMGLGFSFDNGDWLLMSELTRIEMDGYFQDTDSAYITLGRRIFDVTPYLTASWIESKDNQERDGTPFAVLDTRRQAYSLGFRWDVVPGVAAKIDWTHARGFGDTTGGLINNQRAVFPNPNTENRPWDSTDVYTVRIDAAF